MLITRFSPEFPFFFALRKTVSKARSKSTIHSDDVWSTLERPGQNPTYWTPPLKFSKVFPLLFRSPFLRTVMTGPFYLVEMISINKTALLKGNIVVQPGCYGSLTFRRTSSTLESKSGRVNISLLTIQRNNILHRRQRCKIFGSYHDLLKHDGIVIIVQRYFILHRW